MGERGRLWNPKSPPLSLSFRKAATFLPHGFTLIKSG